jgi:hypothetical protein
MTMQIAAMVGLIVAVVMCVAKWLKPGPLVRNTVRINRPALDAGKGKHHG